MRLSDMQTRVSSGYGKVAQFLGRSGVVYRPMDALAPLAVRYAEVMCVLDRDAGLSMKAPSAWGAPMVYGITNCVDIAVGDILSLDEANYFVARAEPLKPALCVSCDSIVTVSGVAGTTTTVVAGCPASIWLKARGESDGSGVPGATRPGQYIMFLPLLPDVMLLPYITVTTDRGAAYTINAVEVSSCGFRCTMSLQQV